MARVRNGSVAVSADLSELGNAVGALQSLTHTVQTDKFLSPLVEGTHRHLANEFNLYMDAMATDERFKHVYEWGVPGPAGRLWKHELKGRGTNRMASWAWMASKKAIPTPLERAQNTEDPMSNVPRKNLERLSKTRYVFHWKAPVMEYNHPVNIEPVNAQMLFIPSWNEKGFVFVDSATVENPGGEKSTGQFTATWVAWWTNLAPMEMENQVNRMIQTGVTGSVKRTLASGKSRKATVSLSTYATFDQGMRQGRKWAERNLEQWASEYRARNMERIINEYAN